MEFLNSMITVSARKLLQHSTEELKEILRGPFFLQFDDGVVETNAFETAGILGVGKGFFARLAEEDDAEKLDHGKTGERGNQRDGAGDDRQQHVEITLR